MTKKNSVSFALPDEFVALCKRDGVTPDEVLRGFIADLCALAERPFVTNGSDERMYAQQYYDRCGYPYRGER